MRILISIAITKVFHQLCRCIPKVQRNGQITRTAHLLKGGIDTLISRIVLLGTSEIDHRFSQRYAPLRPSYAVDCIEGSVCQQQSIGVRKSDILGCADHYSACDKAWIFASFNHPSHPIEGGIGVSSTDRLDECRHKVIVHLTVLIVCQGVFLQLFLHEFIGDNNLI